MHPRLEIHKLFVPGYCLITITLKVWLGCRLLPSLVMMAHCDEFVHQYVVKEYEKLELVQMGCTKTRSVDALAIVVGRYICCPGLVAGVVTWKTNLLAPLTFTIPDTSKAVEAVLLVSALTAVLPLAA